MLRRNLKPNKLWLSKLVFILRCIKVVPVIIPCKCTRDSPPIFGRTHILWFSRHILFKKTQSYCHLWYFHVNSVFMHPVFHGFEYKLYCISVIFLNCAWIHIFISRREGDYKTHSVRECVCVTFLKRAVHHTGCFSLAFSMFYDLIAYVFSFDAVFLDLGPLLSE